MSYRSISSSSGVASPGSDIGVLSIMGLGEGRGVILWDFFLSSASFSFSHCSAILPQSTAEEEALLLGLQGEEEDRGGLSRQGGALIYHHCHLVAEEPNYKKTGSIQRSSSPQS